MPKIYRFAMFGRSASGKTCILTALSINHKSNPQGFTVTWVLDPPEAQDPDPEVAKQYREGQKMLERARAAMEAGDKPPPTDLRILRYRFDFTTPQPNARTYNVELVDYSGELIDPRVNAESLARKLRSLFNTMDGLFVLAEAPPEGQENQHLSREFELLQQAFALLAAEKARLKVAARIPVVLLFNKWDRRHAGANTPKERTAQVEEFLNRDPEPPHRNLVNFLMGAVADGCYHSEAVSAFGKPRLEKQTDQEGVTRMVELPPRERPLPSFGLEDGFVWAARCRDEIDISEFEQASEELAYAKLFPWLGLNALNPFAANTLRKEGAELAARFPKNSDRQHRVRGGVSKVFRITTLRSFTLIALCFLSLLGIESSVDMWRIRKVQADNARQDMGMEELREHMKTLEAYNRAPGYRHLVSRLFFSRNDAKALIADIDRKGEKLAWDPVLALAPDIIGQAAPAQNYLVYYENGDHAPEAHSIILKAEPLRKQRDNGLHLDKLTAKLEELGKTPKLIRSDVQAASRLLEQLPFADALTADQSKMLAAHRQKVGDLLVRVGEIEVVAKIEGLLANNKFEAAGAVAEEMKIAGHDIKPFARATIDRAGESVANALRLRQYSSIRTTVGEVRRGWENKRLLEGDQIKKVKKWEGDGYLGEDKLYYADVRTYYDKARCKTYLDSPIPVEYKRMKQLVKEYLDALERLDGPLSCTIECVSVTMGTRKNYTFKDIRCQVYVQGSQIYSATKLDWDAKTSHDVNRKTTITASLNDQIKIRVRLYNDGVNVDDLGDKEWPGRVYELSDKTIELPLTDQYKEIGGDKYASKVRFRMTYPDSRPTLVPYAE